jgi:hypothetical protein
MATTAKDLPKPEWDWQEEFKRGLQDACGGAPPEIDWTDQQRAFLDAVADPNIRVILGCGGEQTGKSLTAAEALKRLYLQHPTETFILGSPSFKEITNAGPLESFLRRLGSAAQGLRLDRVAGCLRNSFGGKIILWSEMTSGQMITHTAFAIELEEASRCKDSVIDDLFERTKFHWHNSPGGGKIIMPSTFYRDTGRFWQLSEQGFTRKHPSIRAYRFTYEDLIEKGVASWEIIEEARERLTPEEFARRYEGKATSHQGYVIPWKSQVVIPNQTVAEKPSDRTWATEGDLLRAGWKFHEATDWGGWAGWTPPEYWPIVMGLDYGYDDPCCLVWCAVAPDETWIVFDEIHERQVDLPLVFREAQGRPHWRPEGEMWAGGAATEKQITLSLYGYGVYGARVREAEKTYALQRLRDSFTYDKIRFLERQTPNVIRSVSRARYRERREDDTQDKVRHRDSHGLDALTYAKGNAAMAHWEELLAMPYLHPNERLPEYKEEKVLRPIMPYLPPKTESVKVYV